MAGIKIVDLPPLGRDLASTDLLELSLAGGTGSRKITGQEIMNTSKLNIGTTAITSGTVGRVLFEGTGNVVQESANLFWDNTNGRLGIGTSSPTRALSVNGDITSTDSYFTRSYALVSYTFNGNSQIAIYPAGTNILAFNTASLERIRIASTGNFLINTTTDAGFRLDVNGTARVQDNLTITKNQNAATLISMTNTTSAASSVVGVNLTSSSGEAVFAKKPALGSVYKTILGNDTYIANNTAGDISMLNDFATGRIKFAAGGASTAQMTLFSTGNLGINTTTDAGFRLDVNGTARMQGNVEIGGASATTVYSTYNSTTRNQIKYTNGSSFEFHEGVNERIRIAAGGNVSIGTTNSFDRLQNNGGMCFGAFNNATINYGMGEGNHTYLQFATNGVNVMRISPIQNVLIGTTTDAGFRLDVNGTARIDQTLQLNATGTGTLIAMGGNIGRFTIDGLFIRFKVTGGGDILNMTTNFFGVNETAVIPSAICAMTSTNRGFLPPRMTQTQRNAIASPAIGLEIYQTDATEGKYIYKSSGWTYIG